MTIKKLDGKPYKVPNETSQGRHCFCEHLQSVYQLVGLSSSTHLSGVNAPLQKHKCLVDDKGSLNIEGSEQ